VLTGITLSTLLTQANGLTAEVPATGFPVVLVDAEFNTVADEGTTNSFFHLYAADSVWHRGTISS
jgi:hypothetical protein